MHYTRSAILASLASGVIARPTYGQPYVSCCDALAEALPERVFFPDSDTYNATIVSYPFTQLQLHPSCVVRPESAEDVSTAVVLMGKRGSKFAVKGGGHNANSGFNNIEAGITIDMQSLNEVSLEGEIAHVDAGTLSQKVYDTLEPYNVSAMVGRIGVVGVAGFLTGGGIGFSSPELGWACDYIKNIEVVLANGDIVDANADENKDLFTALKGGQSNFGIVTRFDLQTFEQATILGGRVMYGPDADTALFDAFTNFKSGEYDPYAAGWVTNSYNSTSKTYNPSSTVFYTNPETGPGALKEIMAVQPQLGGGMLEVPAGNISRTAGLAVKAATRGTIWATTSFYISPTILHKINGLWKETIPKIGEKYAGAKLSSELTFQSIPPSSKEHGQNALGFKPDSNPEKLIFMQIMFYFDDETATDGLYDELKEYIASFDAIAEEEGKSSPFIYLNFAAWFQKPFDGYGADNLAKLQATAKKYDPTGFYQTQLKGGFKLF